MASVTEIKEYRKETPRHLETTDMALFVRTSSEAMDGWDRSRIVDALLRETFIDEGTAEDISLEIENNIKQSGIKVITAPLIREMVNAKLLERGLEGDTAHAHPARRASLRRGSTHHPPQQGERQRAPRSGGHQPDARREHQEGIRLLNVFDQSVGDAHMRGDIHLHDLGFIDRPYCSGQSLEYIKKFGLNLPNSLAMAKPAKHPEVLLAHMVKFAAALQSHFAGAIGWDAVNLFFAPYLRGLPKRDVRQLAQMLIFEFSQQAVARGGQAIFTDINLYWEVPKHFENVPAIGPGGSSPARPTRTTCPKPRISSGRSSTSTERVTARDGPSSSPSR